MSNLVAVEVPRGSIREVCAAYEAMDDVIYAEPDRPIWLDDFPNDPSFPDMWGLQNVGQDVLGFPGTPGADINAAAAWDKWTGDSEFRIAVIDTGIDYTHPDLAPNMWVNPGEIPGNGVDDDGNGYVDDVHGYDFTSPDHDPRDVIGHGTHVAGTIGAVGNNASGVVGVNWRCKLVALQIFRDDGVGNVFTALSAFEYVIANGIRVSNNSWGGGDSQPLRDMLEVLQGAGHIVVAAAGNGNLFSGNPEDTDVIPHLPGSADSPNVLSVAATNKDDDRAAFSNYGLYSVDVGAPGRNVLSTIPGGEFTHFSGTSMATPHTTGVVALLWSHSPELPWDQVIDRVVLTTRSIASMNDITRSGGMIDARAVLGDCDDNGVVDETEIATGSTSDCNANGIPDHCEAIDCNLNLVPDSCDIDTGTSDDCNGNGAPDECDPDCNANGTPDDCDISSGAIADCNANGIPDDCEDGHDRDCNANEVPDLCDVNGPTSRDCNRNGVPDECEATAPTCFSGVSFVPVSATGAHTIDGRTIHIQGGGQTVTVDMFLAGWDPDLDGDYPLLFAFILLDESGFEPGAGEIGSIVYRQQACVEDDDCRTEPIAQGVCMPDGFCDNQAFVYGDPRRPDYLYFGLPAIVGSDSGRPVFGGVGIDLGYWSSIDGVLDSGVPKHVWTILLDVPEGALGTFEITADINSLTPEGLLFTRFDSIAGGGSVAMSESLPARIVVTQCATDGDCDDGLFCNGMETCNASQCQAGTPVDCSHLTTDCTTGFCDEVGDSCVQGAPDDEACATGQFCQQRVCDRDLGCVPTNFCTPQDGNPCPSSETCNDTTDTCGICEPPTVVATSRYLSITPPDLGSTQMALLVRGDCTDASVFCVSKYVDFDDPVDPGDPTLGRLIATPVYRTFAAWQTVDVRDLAINPNTAYWVHTECNPGAEQSAGALVVTAVHGDTDDNGKANFADITRTVSAFQGAFSPTLTLQQTDLIGGGGCLPDRVADFADITECVTGFKELPSVCASPCP